MNLGEKFIKPKNRDILFKCSPSQLSKCLNDGAVLSRYDIIPRTHVHNSLVRFRSNILMKEYLELDTSTFLR